MDRVHVDAEAWNVDAAAFPADGSAIEKWRFLLRYAVLAPSTRNTQAWKFRLSEGGVDVFIDAERQQRIADADQREMFISAGCALENLRIAARRFGCAVRVEHAPDPLVPALAARVALDEAGSTADAHTQRAFAAITRRFTNHGVYDGSPVAQADLDALRELTEEPDTSLDWCPDEATRSRIDELVMRADALLLSRAEYRHELGELIGSGAFGNPWLVATLGRFAVSYLMPASSMAANDHKALMSSPALGLIGARENTRAAQVRAGQVLERIYLAAVDLGLSLQPVSQLMQTEETREALARLLPGGGVPLQPFRLGRGTAPKAHTPRRPLVEMLL